MGTIELEKAINTFLETGEELEGYETEKAQLRSVLRKLDCNNYDFTTDEKEAVAIVLEGAQEVADSKFARAVISQAVAVGL